MTSPTITEQSSNFNALRIPAKTILFGEYGVLQGGKAVAVTFFSHFFELNFFWQKVQKEFANVRVKTEFVSDNETKDECGLSPFFKNLLVPWAELLSEYDFQIEVVKSFSPALGFGSSSALIAGVSKALWQFFFPGEDFLENEIFWKKVRQSLALIQGQGSCYDIAVQLAALEEDFSASASHYWVFQNRSDTPVPFIKKISLTEEDSKYGFFLPTQVYSNTKNAVKIFQDEKRKDEFAKRHAALAEEFIADSSLSNLINLMKKSREIAVEQGLLSVQEFSAQRHLRNLLSYLEEKRIPYKTLGAGYGDSLWILADKNEFAVFDLPPELLRLQNKILQLRQEEKLEIQNGDLGFASAPSNIALIKYWGKKPGRRQIPVNSSLSFTLGGLRSFTKVTVLGRFFPMDVHGNTAKFKNKFRLAKSEASLPDAKMNNWLKNVLSPFADEIALDIESNNNFPTACGIASSASGYAALTGSIADLLQLEKHFTAEELQYWLVEWARLGSGSATRSAVLGEELFVKWESPVSPSPSRVLQNSYSSTQKVDGHEKWSGLQHCVFILDANKKETSSSDGHTFAHLSPLQAVRVAGIPARMKKIEKALADFDFETVRQLTEEDAFAMHSVMQTGSPPVCYFNKDVTDAIALFIKLRDKSKAQAMWTLDAGPNIHLLFMPEAKDFIKEFHAELNKIFSFEIKIIFNSLQLPGGRSKNGLSLGYKKINEHVISQ